jgi:glycosyltransferase involved in cell wall biosynthesis
MIIGGAQENTMLSCALTDPNRFASEIVCGAETGPEGSLLGACRDRRVNVHVEHSLVRRIHPVLDALALIRLTAMMRRGRYDVVHTHSSKAGVLGRIAARLAGTRAVVHTAHGWPFSREEAPLARAMWIRLEGYCARLCQAIVVVASSDREAGLALGVGTAKQYQLIRSGIEIETYRDGSIDRNAARARLGLPNDAFVVVSVGRLSRQKAPLDLLAGFSKLAAHRPDAHLVIVGDGPLRHEVENTVRDRGLSGRVHLLGLRSDVHDILPAADVFALSSHWEGLPRVLPQAMAAGLPIVATRAGGAADAIVPGRNGWLIEVGDVEALGAGLIAFANDPAAARAMGEQGRDRVEEFSARGMVERLEILYERVLKGAPVNDSAA